MRAHEIAEIRDPSPIVTLVLHRLLLAFLYSALRGPSSIAKLEEIIALEDFDADLLQTYADDNRDAFWLLGDSRRFLQDSSLPQEFREHRKRPSSAHLLIRESSSPESVTLFDHTLKQGPELSRAEAARYLLADSWYGLQDGRGYQPSPLSFGVALLVRGRSLFETLAYNLVPYNSRSPIPSLLPDDRPIWEGPSRHPSDLPNGWLDYLTRPYRRLYLVEGDDGAVASVYRASEVGLDKDWRSRTHDPALALRVTDKGSRPLRLDPTRSLWRDSHVLYGHLMDYDQGNPGYRRVLANLGARSNVTAIGVAAEHQKVKMWQRSDLPFHHSLLDARTLGALAESIALADKIRNLVARHIDIIARYVLIPNNDALPRDESDRQWQRMRRRLRGKPSRADQFQRAVNWEPTFWATLGGAFPELLAGLTAEEPSHSPDAWTAELRRAATSAFYGVVRTVGDTANVRVAVAKAEQGFVSALTHMTISGIRRS